MAAVASVPASSAVGFVGSLVDADVAAARLEGALVVVVAGVAEVAPAVATRTRAGAVSTATGGGAHASGATGSAGSTAVASTVVTGLPTGATAVVVALAFDGRFPVFEAGLGGLGGIVAASANNENDEAESESVAHLLFPFLLAERCGVPENPVLPSCVVKTT